MGSRIAPGQLALITALTAMGVASMALYIPSLPAIQAEFGVKPSETQLTLTLFFLGFAGAQLLFGPLSDRFGRRPVLIAGLALYAAVSLGIAFATGIEDLQIGRFLQGFFACVGPVVGRAVVRDRVDGQHAAAAFAILGTAIAIVPALAPVIGGLIEVNIGWRANFLLLMGASLLLMVICLRSLPESLAEKNLDAIRPGRLLRNYGSLLCNRYFMGQVLVSSLAFAGFFAYVTESPFLIVGELGIAADKFGFLMIFTVMGYTTGSIAAGRLARRWSARRLILTGYGFMLTGASLLWLLSGELSLYHLIPPMMVYTVGFGMIIPSSMSEAMRPFPRLAGSASAILGSFQFLCATITSFAVQPLYDGTTELLSQVILGVIVLAVVQYLVLTRKGPPQ